jgi:hypothetical protein
MQQAIHSTYPATPSVASTAKQLMYRGCSYQPAVQSLPTETVANKVGRYRGVRYEIVVSQAISARSPRLAKYRGHAYYV